MLILSRKIGESIVIDGRITVRIMRLEGEVVKLGIEAPREVPVHRQEVYLEIQKNNQEALSVPHPKVPQLIPQPGVDPLKTRPL
jgi:carbon storage regulator